MSTDQFIMYDAAYVLGALSPADRREFEDHLKDCAACAKAVGELAGLPGLMSKVSVDQVTAEVEAPPETLLPSLARAVRRERRRRRLTMGAAAAAAACLLVVGAVAVTKTSSPDQPPVASSSSVSGTARQAMKAVVPTPVTASAQLVDTGWGTRINLTCSYDAKSQSPPGGFPYALVVIDRNGATQQVATWKAPPGRQLTIIGTSSLARQDISAVEIRTLSGRALLRLAT